MLKTGNQAPFLWKGCEVLAKHGSSANQLDEIKFSSQAVGNSHAARRCGIQCMQPKSFGITGVFWMPHRRAA